MARDDPPASSTAAVLLADGRGGKGPCPQTMNKNKNSAAAHMLVLQSAAAINDHKTVHKQGRFAPFQAYDNTKKCSACSTAAAMRGNVGSEFET